MCIRDRIKSNPVYGTNALGILIPSLVWLFSISPAITLGRAKELPLRVCNNSFLPSLFLNLRFKRFDWYDLKFDTELISNHFLCPFENISKSYVEELIE